MMLTLKVKHKRNKTNKLIQHVFLSIMCPVHENF